MYASVKCVGGCKAGFVMRAEKTPDGGMKGVLMSVTENDLVPYLVTIDATGKEISREPLPAPAGRGGGRGTGGAAATGAAASGGPTGGAQAGGGAAPTAPDNPTARMAAATAALGGRAPNPGPPPPMSPELAAQYPKESRLAARPAGAFTPGDYNAVEVLLTDNSVQPRFNGGALGGNSSRHDPRRGQGRLRPNRLLRRRLWRSPNQGLHVQGHPQPRLGTRRDRPELQAGPRRSALLLVEHGRRRLQPRQHTGHRGRCLLLPRPRLHSRQADLRAGVVQSDVGMADSGDGQPRLRLHRRTAGPMCCRWAAMPATVPASSS